MVAAGAHLVGDAEPGGQRIRVIFAQGPPPCREHLPELVLRPRVVSAGGHFLGDAQPGGQRIRVGWPQLVPLISQSPLILRDRLVRAPGLLVGRCQTSVSCQRVRVIQPQFVLVISQSLLVQHHCRETETRHQSRIAGARTLSAMHQRIPATGITTLGKR